MSYTEHFSVLIPTKHPRKYIPPPKPKPSFYNPENVVRLTGPVKQYTKEEIEEYIRRLKNEQDKNTSASQEKT
jgi:hypothetical protein